MNKFFKYISILFSLLVIVAFFYAEFSPKIFLKKENKKLIYSQIKQSSKLPENFLNFYSTVYPKSLEKNYYNFLWNRWILKNDAAECPCHDAANKLFPIVTNRRGGNLVIIPNILTRYIEKNFTQEECLNFNYSNFDFLYFRKGIENVSQNLFAKDVSELKPVEIAEILALHESPVQNNRLRNPDSAARRTQHFNSLFLKNSKNNNEFQHQYQRGLAKNNRGNSAETSA